MDLETQLQHTGTDLANKLQRASTEVEEERGREQHRLEKAQREGWVTWTWVGDPEPHCQSQAHRCDCRQQSHHPTALQSTPLN